MIHPVSIRPFWLRASTGGRLHGLITRPLWPRRRLPAVVVVPGAVGSGRMMAARADARALAASGVAVIGFNAAGRSNGRPWDIRSGGTGDLNGPADQDDLASVVRMVARHRAVDASRIGIYSVSFGLAAVLGAVSRHPGLPLRFLVDEEGPTDCFAAALRAWTLAPSDGDHWPARARALFQRPCADAGFWEPREPIRGISSFRGYYLRLQAEWDHVQPPQRLEQVDAFHQPPLWWQGCHAIRLNNAAVAAGVPWVRINPRRFGNPVGATYSVRKPPQYVPGHMADHPALWTEAVAELLGVLRDHQRRGVRLAGR